MTLVCDYLLRDRKERSTWRVDQPHYSGRQPLLTVPKLAPTFVVLATMRQITSNNGLIFSLVLLLASLGAAYRVERNNLRGPNTKQRRPVMHTFFSQLTPVGKQGKSAGMTENAHSQMISTWRDSWQQAGWDTRVLTMDDVKQHPEFAQLDEVIRKFNMNEYEKTCYYRWLAMAAVGGGWMSGT